MHLLLFLNLLLAQAATTVTETVDLEGTPIWLIALDYAWKIAIPLILAYFAKKFKDSETKKAALQAIEAAVDQTYLSYVRQAKKDGKFDGKVARDKAVELAKNLASGAGKKIITAWGKDALESLVHKIANRKKRENK